MKTTRLKNQVQLVTYADSLGRNLKELSQVLDTHIGRYIGGIHLLPFYPSSADRGFAPLTHREVNPVMGEWSDIRQLSEKYDLVVDLIANHISAQSAYYQDFLQKGNDSLVADMFLTAEKVFGGEVEPVALSKIYRPRPTSPFQEVLFGDGVVRKVWMSFSSEQIDVDWDSPVTHSVMGSFLDQLSVSGAKLVRLDAIGYILKRPGTDSFLVPEVYDRIEWMAERTRPLGVEFLPEVHFHYRKQIEIAEKCDWVYDFALPMLVLYALIGVDARPLKHWLTIRPNNAITTLDTHDGIGVTDVEDLLTPEQIETVRRVLVDERGANEAVRAVAGDSRFDLYQLNTSYYSASGSDDAYLVARAIQFFVPGIPQVYHMGILAGANDVKKYARTSVGRDLNRHDYTVEEIETEISRPVVQRLLALMEWRNSYPVFEGEFRLEESATDALSLIWTSEGRYEARLNVNLKNLTAIIGYRENGEWKEFSV